MANTDQRAKHWWVAIAAPVQSVPHTTLNTTTLVDGEEVRTSKSSSDVIALLQRTTNVANARRMVAALLDKRCDKIHLAALATTITR